MLLDLRNAPTDAIERIIYLDSVLGVVHDELEDAYAAAYFEARIQRRFPDALRVGKMSKKRALALTRKRNEQTGRSVRWGDGADPSSTAYSD